MKAATNQDNGARSQLADHLQTNKDLLIKEWLSHARGDAQVLSDGLTQLELMDHLPNVFDAMVEALRNRCRKTANDVQEISARHTVIRWVQNYDLRAVLREVSLLRTAFIRQLLAFDAAAEDLHVDERLLNTTTIHHILDDIVMDATETFLKLEDRATDG